MRYGRLFFLLLLASLGAVVYWYYRQPPDWETDLWCHRLAQAKSRAEVEAALAWFEAPATDDQRPRALVARFGTGLGQLDRHLCRHLLSSQASERLRLLFSAELSWRPEQLTRWARYWAWHQQNVDEELTSLDGYLEAVLTRSPPRRLNGRELLDLQAAMQLTGQPRLAHRLSNDNWPDRCRQWQATRDTWPHPLPHFDTPFDEPAAQGPKPS